MRSIQGFVSRILAGVATICLWAMSALSQPAAQGTTTLHGATQFGDDHVVNKTLLKFEELVREYYGKPVGLALHRNGELGLERDYLAYMSKGSWVDYAIVAPAHLSTFSRAALLLDAPFLFRGLDHWSQALDADVLKPIADEVAQNADVMIIGYAGGSTRNVFADKPVRDLAGMKGLKIRVPGAPIWSKAFSAVGMSPTVIAANAINKAIQGNLIEAGENDISAIETLKLHELGPNLVLTEHAITIRPIIFSAKTFRALPADLQAAIVKAGKEAGAYGRQIEPAEDAARRDVLESVGKLQRILFADRAAMRTLAEPAIAGYAAEIGAGEVYQQINAIK